jgi:hypothetical protein
MRVDEHNRERRARDVAERLRYERRLGPLGLAWIRHQALRRQERAWLAEYLAE